MLVNHFLILLFKNVFNQNHTIQNHVRNEAGVPTLPFPSPQITLQLLSVDHLMIFLLVVSMVKHFSRCCMIFNGIFTNTP